MDQITAAYREMATQTSFNVANKVLPMAKMPESLVAAYDGLLAELLKDSDGTFSQAWAALPASAQKLMPQAQFHGFYIANAWLQL
ncbi:MAG: DUF3069 domain-containing protein, partial [Shewanella sp.]